MSAVGLAALYLLIGFGVVGMYLARYSHHLHDEFAREAEKRGITLWSVYVGGCLAFVGFAVLWPLVMPAMALGAKRRP